MPQYIIHKSIAPSVIFSLSIRFVTKPKLKHQLFEVARHQMSFKKTKKKDRTRHTFLLKITDGAKN